MKSEKLNVGDFGDEVAILHANLKQYGFDVSEEEVKRKFFGPATRAAVQQFQKQQGLPVSGAVDEHSATAMNAATSKLNTQNSPFSAATLSVAAGSPVTTATAALSPGILRSGPGGPRTPTFIVHGFVLQADGVPLVGATVHAFDQDMRTRDALGDAVTDEDGAYAIPYGDPAWPDIAGTPCLEGGDHVFIKSVEEFACPRRTGGPQKTKRANDHGQFLQVTGSTGPVALSS